jgi:hypothetical protein
MDDEPNLSLDPTPKTGPAILIYDIETSPILGHVWDMWDTSVLEVERDWTILCFAYKWYGKRGTKFVAAWHDPEWGTVDDGDRWVAERLHHLFSRADVIMAHNNDRFDQRKAQARFLAHGLPPPEPSIRFDTLKQARKHFAFGSNKLDELARQLGLGRKVPHTGKHTWLGCMNGDPKSQRLMERYNRRDVLLLEELYETIKGWADVPFFNAGWWSTDESLLACAKCGKTGTLIKRGFRTTRSGRYQRFQCSYEAGGCGGYSTRRHRRRTPEREPLLK